MKISACDADRRYRREKLRILAKKSVFPLKNDIFSEFREGGAGPLGPLLATPLNYHTKSSNIISAQSNFSSIFIFIPQHLLHFLLGWRAISRRAHKDRSFRLLGIHSNAKAWHKGQRRRKEIGEIHACSTHLHLQPNQNNTHKMTIYSSILHLNCA